MVAIAPAASQTTESPLLLGAGVTVYKIHGRLCLTYRHLHTCRIDIDGQTRILRALLGCVLIRLKLCFDVRSP
jgi:hypothetical protein